MNRIYTAKTKRVTILLSKNLSRLRPSRKKVEKTPSDFTQRDDLDLGAAWGFSVAEDVEQLPGVGDVRWQGRKRSGLVT
jgi:hypothetical protein